jgi:imidazolonepropionase-like amidohydrolase
MIDTFQSLSDKLVYLDAGTTTVVTGGRLIDGTGREPVGDATIVIVGDRIRAAGPAAAVKAPSGHDVRTIDAKGKTILPGFIDAHVHFTGDTGRSAYERYLPGNMAYRAIVAQRHAVEALNAGFTTMRVLGHGPAEVVYALRQGVAEGWVPGPRFLTSGWAISASGGHGYVHFLPPDLNERFRPRSTFATGPDECRRMARLNFAEGADLIKIYTSEGSLVGTKGVKNYIPNFTVEEIAALADEAHRRGAKLATHATHAEGVRNAVLGGVDTVEHGGEIDAHEDILDMMIERGVFLNPTLTIYHALITEGPAWGVKPYGIARATEAFERQKGFLKRALDKGLKVSLGTDSGLFGHGGSAKEFALLVECGLTPMDAIVAGTKTAAACLGLEHHLGTLEVGKAGELVVFDGDPLRDIAALQDAKRVKTILKTKDQLT